MDTVSWEKLKHAYGAAADIPGHLRALVDPDPAVRARARGHLSGALAHQGSRYPASGPAVPFVLEALDAQDTDRAEVLDLLAALANGQDCDWWVTGHPPGRRAGAIGGHGKKAYAAVVKGLPRLLAALQDPSARVRASAAHLLAWLGTEAERIVPSLVAAIQTEGDADALASELLALGYLGDDDADGVLEAYLHDPRRPAREAAAVAALRRGRVDDAVLAPIEAVLRGARPVLQWWDLRPHELNEELYGWPIPDAGASNGPWGSLAPIAFAQLPALLATDRSAALSLCVSLCEGDGDLAESAGRLAFVELTAPGADPALRDRLLRALGTRESAWIQFLPRALAERGLPAHPRELRASLGLPPRWFDAPARIGDREVPPRVALAEALAADRGDELLERVLELPSERAFEVLLAWSGADAAPPELLARAAEGLAALPGIEEAVEERVLTWRRDGLPREFVDRGWVLIATSQASLAVRVGMALARRGVPPRRWFEGAAAFLVETPLVVEALAVLPVERRVELVRWALAKEGADVVVRLAPCAPVPEVIAPTVRRFAAWGKGSQIDRYVPALAAFGPAARPFLEAAAADPTLWKDTRAVFAKALRLLG